MWLTGELFETGVVGPLTRATEPEDGCVVDEVRPAGAWWRGAGEIAGA